MSTTPPVPEPRAAHNERVEATASYLNGMAGAIFAAGVITPAIAVLFGVVGAFTPAPGLTLAASIAISFGASLSAHYAARRVLDRIKE